MHSNLAIPAVPGLPLVGSLFDFRDRRLELQRRLADECGDIGSYRMGRTSIIAISSAELVQSTLVEHADAFIQGRGIGTILRPLFGNGLLTSTGEIHKRQRKLLAPAFSPRRIANYAQTIAEYSEQAQAGWKDGQTLDLAEEMMKLTLAIVARTLFDADVSRQTRIISEGLTVAMQYMVGSVTSFFQVPYHWPTPGNRRMHRAIANLDEVVFSIIRARRADVVDKGDVLSMLLLARNEDDNQGMDDRQVRDESLTILLAGHETTANALAWTWHLLTTHPSIYERMLAEIDDVLQNRTPSVTDLPRLSYTLQVIKEAMRIYPPAYIMGRRALRDVQIGPYLVQRGSTVVVNIYGMHHRARYFPEPERFLPERFEPEAEKLLPKCAYIPFGAGPRVCIGSHFAMMEAQLILATLAQRIRFEPVGRNAVQPEPLVTLRPRGGVPVRLQRRAPSHAMRPLPTAQAAERTST
jgi:cytochrome P450